MLNLQSLFKKTIEAVHGLNIKYDLKVDMDLIVYLQRIMKNILVNLADYYPQAPITGGTLKMKGVINEVNRVDD